MTLHMNGAFELVNWFWTEACLRPWLGIWFKIELFCACRRRILLQIVPLTVERLWFGDRALVACSDSVLETESRLGMQATCMFSYYLLKIMESMGWRVLLYLRRWLRCWRYVERPLCWWRWLRRSCCRLGWRSSACGEALKQSIVPRLFVLGSCLRFSRW